jgi:hypothetical protein
VEDRSHFKDGLGLVPEAGGVYDYDDDLEDRLPADHLAQQRPASLGRQSSFFPPVFRTEHDNDTASYTSTHSAHSAGSRGRSGSIGTAGTGGTTSKYGPQHHNHTNTGTGIGIGSDGSPTKEARRIGSGQSMGSCLSTGDNATVHAFNDDDVATNGSSSSRRRHFSEDSRDSGEGRQHSKDAEKGGPNLYPRGSNYEMYKKYNGGGVSEEEEEQHQQRRQQMAGQMMQPAPGSPSSGRGGGGEPLLRMSSSECLQIGLMLSQQEAEFGTNMYDSLEEADEAMIRRLVARGLTNDEAVLEIFELKFGIKGPQSRWAKVGAAQPVVSTMSAFHQDHAPAHATAHGACAGLGAGGQYPAQHQPYPSPHPHAPQHQQQHQQYPGYGAPPPHQRDLYPNYPPEPPSFHAPHQQQQYHPHHAQHQQHQQQPAPYGPPAETETEREIRRRQQLHQPHAADPYNQYPPVVSYFFVLLAFWAPYNHHVPLFHPCLFLLPAASR